MHVLFIIIIIIFSIDKGQKKCHILVLVPRFGKTALLERDTETKQTYRLRCLVFLWNDWCQMSGHMESCYCSCKGYTCSSDKQRSSFSGAVRLLPLPDIRLFKNSQCKKRKIHYKARFIYLPICKSCCIDQWIQWIKLSLQGILTGMKIEPFSEL